MRLRLPWVTIGLAAASLGCQDELPSAPRTPTLEANVELTLDANQGSERVYTLTVPPGTARLRFALYGGIGDADLAVRFGEAPSASGADCVSATEFDLEECIIDEPEAGTWYVLIYAYTSYSDVRLLPNTYATGGTTVMQNGVDILDLAGPTGSFDVFSLVVPTGTDSLVVDLNATGDVDLYLDLGRIPTLNNYQCASFTPTGSERCVILAPTAGTWTVRIDAYASYSAGTLRGTYFSPAAAR